MSIQFNPTGAPAGYAEIATAYPCASSSWSWEVPDMETDDAHLRLNWSDHGFSANNQPFIITADPGGGHPALLRLRGSRLRAPVSRSVDAAHSLSISGVEVPAESAVMVTPSAWSTLGQPTATLEPYGVPAGADGSGCGCRGGRGAVLWLGVLLMLVGRRRIRPRSTNA